jgi:hypothetical protein
MNVEVTLRAARVGVVLAAEAASAHLPGLARTI